MKEIKFIEQNKDKWKRFEKLYREKNTNPDELGKLFIEITEDLSYARTYYPKRSVRVYLNYLAQKVFTGLYKLQKQSFRQFFRFWTISLPLELYRARKHILYSFLIFVIAALAGVFSTADDLSFANLILGDYYIEKTNEYIENGNPMAVYQQQSELPMFLQIFFNNIQIAFITFALGILLGIGTVFILVYNGIIIGTFQSYFYFKGLQTGLATAKALLFTSFSVIWLHGAFEICSIIIAGAAGLTLGSGLMFPDTWSRIHSLQIAAKRGIKIMLGLFPFILFAAIIESWVSRYSDMPVALKLLIIFSSLAIMIIYFIIYPQIVVRKNPSIILIKEKAPSLPQKEIELNKIRPMNEVFADAFFLFRKLYPRFAKPLWLTFIPLSLIIAAYTFFQNKYYVSYQLPFYRILKLIFSCTDNFSWDVFLMNTFAFSLNAAYMATLVNYKSNQKHFYKKYFTNVFFAWPVVFIVYFLSVYFSMSYLIILIIVLPLLLPLIYPLAAGHYRSLIESVGFSFTNWANNFALFFALTGILILLFFLTDAPVQYYAFESIKWITIIEADNFELISNSLLALQNILFIHLSIPLIVFAYALTWYSEHEKKYATGLFEKLKIFGKTNKTHEQESDYE
jgi:uncharacterized membrane protein SpoIIM required for sporulation